MSAQSLPERVALTRFDFGTVFDRGGAVTHAPARTKLTYNLAEVEHIRKEARAEGEAQALAGVAQTQALALEAIGRACAQALPKLAEVAHAHRQGSADLALACARAIADAALDRFPQAPLQAAMIALAREIETQPKLVVICAPELAGNLQPLLDETAQAIGFAGQIVLRPDAESGPHAFTLDFGDGHAAFDPTAAAARVAEALDAALAAEGLHAEPLIPSTTPTITTQTGES